MDKHHLCTLCRRDWLAMQALKREAERKCEDISSAEDQRLLAAYDEEFQKAKFDKWKKAKKDKTPTE